MFWWSADHPVTDKDVTNMFSPTKKKQVPQINNVFVFCDYVTWVTNSADLTYIS